MHSIRRGSFETNMLAKTNTNKLADELAKQEIERHFDRLAHEIHLRADVPCFIVAPRSSGRTWLAHRYTQQYRQGDDVHWLDGSSESFVQGIEAGTLIDFLLIKRMMPGVSEHALVIDDLRYLEPWQAERLSDDLDTLVEQNWRVIVITTPQHDCFDTLQSDRFLITGADLLQNGHCTLQQQTTCLARFFTEALPLEIRLFAALTVILQDLTVEEACTLGFSMHEDLPQTVTMLNPLFVLDAAEQTRLSLKNIPLSMLLKEIQEVFVEHYQEETPSERAARTIEVLTRLSMELLKRGLHARSHEVLTCIEALFVAEYNQVLPGAGSTLDVVPAKEERSERREVLIDYRLINGLRTDRPDNELLSEWPVLQSFVHPLSQALLTAQSQSEDQNQSQNHAQNQLPRQAHSKRQQESLYIRLFGDLEIYRGSVRVEHSYLSGKRTQSLLALLLLNPRKCIAREVAIQQFWPRMSTERAINNFHVACSRLNRSLCIPSNDDSKYLIRNGTLYHLDASLVSTDVDRFEELARLALMGGRSIRERLEATNQMENLYRDDLLAGNHLESVLQQYRKRLRGMLVDALLCAATLTNEVGDVQAALWFTRRAYDFDHSREDVYRALMDAQLNAGQRTSAIETYFACKDFLHEELGILPSIKTTALYQDLILNRG